MTQSIEEIDNDVSEIYQSLWANSIKRYKNNTVQGDSFIHLQNDVRRGLTLVSRIPAKSFKSIDSFIQEGKQIDANQYYYLRDELHITILSIISCNDVFSLHSIKQDEYIDVIAKSLQKIPVFKIRLKGITMSPSCIMLQGFPLDNTLMALRSELRRNFKNSDIYNSIDSRYKLETAHYTAIRIKQQIGNTKSFIDFLKKYKEWNFGILEIKELFLVYNDWYHKSANVKEIHKYKLK